MKKCLMVLTGILALVLFAPMASASFVQCGGAGSVGGVESFAGGIPVNGSGGTAAIVGTGATFTCTGITVPTNMTLTGIDLYLKNDVQAPSALGSGMSFAWASSLPNFAETVSVASSDGINFDECQGASGPYVGVCPVQLHFTENVTQGNPFSTVTVTLAPTAVGGGVSPVGSFSGNLYIQFDESSGVPEPTTLSLIGGALLGLGVFGRKKFRRQ